MTNTPDKRSEDKITHARFRSDRMFQDGNRWFFFTRECTVEGPFSSRIQTINQLDLYIKAMHSGLLKPEKNLSLKPQ
jgi:hypothetical protein